MLYGAVPVKIFTFDLMTVLLNIMEHASASCFQRFQKLWLKTIFDEHQTMTCDYNLFTLVLSSLLDLATATCTD
jgi:hypothetical protein